MDDPYTGTRDPSLRTISARNLTHWPRGSNLYSVPNDMLGVGPQSRGSKTQWEAACPSCTKGSNVPNCSMFKSKSSNASTLPPNVYHEQPFVFHPSIGLLTTKLGFSNKDKARNTRYTSEAL